LREGDSPSPLSTGETPGAVCPLLSSAVQDRPRLTELSPVKGQKYDEEIRAFFIRGEAERGETV